MLRVYSDTVLTVRCDDTFPFMALSGVLVPGACSPDCHACDYAEVGALRGVDSVVCG